MSRKKALTGLFFCGIHMVEIITKNPTVIAFFDGQNLFNAAKKAFGYTFPNYDVKALSHAICEQKGWLLSGVRFYTGVPSEKDHSERNRFWSKKFLHLRHQKVFVFSRPVRYISKTITLPDGTKQKAVVGDEKGIDVRLAVDVISLAHKRAFDVALIFSQDQDLSEVADEIRTIAQEQNRWIKIVSAFPVNPTEKHLNRGINKTDWIPFSKDFYDACIDPRDYR